MTIIQHIQKERLPRHLSYPLHTSEIEHAAKGYGVKTIASLYYSQARSSKLAKYENILLDAAYHPKSNDVYLCNSNSITISVHSVPTKDKHAMHGHLVNNALPSLMKWCQKAFVATEQGTVYSQQRHHFTVTLENEELKIHTT